VAVGGFAFDASREPGGLWARLPYGLVVPRFVYLSSGGSSWISVNLASSPDSDALALLPGVAEELSRWLVAFEEAGESEPVAGLTSASDEPGRDAWHSAVGEVLEAIDRGEVEKVVLARRVRVVSERPIALPAVLRRLREGYPECTVFAYARGGACLLGATPERLVRLRRGQVAADPLAGSAPRGQDAAEDQRWAAALLADDKERREHSLVVRALAEALTPLCSTLDVPASPSLLRVSNVQHLHSPVRGLLSSDYDVLDLVARLHPTPATGGWPVKGALDLIRGLEPFDRGWYAGPVGWVDGRGDGEFAVAIRSAVTSGRMADLFAGCGIVAGSDPEREYAESALKLRAMLWALGGGVE
jgi:isochorismate synthase